MRFQPGEKIKVLNRIGMQSIDTMNIGEFVGPAERPNSFLVKFPIGHYTVDSTSCYKWEPIEDDSDEAMNEWAKDGIAEIRAFLTKAYFGLFGKHDPNRYDYGELENNNDQGLICLWLEGRSISVEPTRIEVRSIGRIKEFYGWSVTTYHTINNYPHHPDDIEDVQFAETRNTLDAAKQAMNAVWELHRDGFFDGVADELFAKQLEQEKAEGLI